jgi:uncharacterized protein YijF (DUF1287 family)
VATVTAATPELPGVAESRSSGETNGTAAQRTARAAEDRETFLLLFAPILIITLVVGALQMPIERDVVRADSGSYARPLLRSKKPSISLAGVGPATALSDAGSKPALILGPPEIVSALPPQIDVAAVLAEREGGRCEFVRVSKGAPQSTAAVSSATFGRLLAVAAAVQTTDLVVYQERYRDIAFPMGDVPALYGVCTDVIVRAYRALGIDLQELVYRARIGIGDRSIDHRRTETLRRFFARYGVSLPISDFAEDYLPGDIVTYSRPSGRTSQSHIAIVSDQVAASGRPMIVHNRAWGPTIEDALFANEITGHYRFDSSQAAAVTAPAEGSRKKQASAEDGGSKPGDDGEKSAGPDAKKSSGAEEKKSAEDKDQKRADASR